ncbi:MAG: Rieske (2Fe-2S) protein [Firmicutes bacterium]|nr:Rieske (2Fe-2S) protein [Bacillota bacterium]
MTDWVEVMQADDLPEGTLKKSSLAGQHILLVKSQGTIYALVNRCPHLGCFLHKGKLHGYKLTCPCHDWTFDLRDGTFLSAPEIRIPVFQVKVENDSIFINLGGK